MNGIYNSFLYVTLFSLSPFLTLDRIFMDIKRHNYKKVKKKHNYMVSLNYAPPSSLSFSPSLSLIITPIS